MGMLALAALYGCHGGSGQPCKSNGPLGPTYCDDRLICDDATNTCQPPMSRNEGESCSSQDLCAAHLWCDNVAKTCRPFLGQGDSCSNPLSCGPTLACLKDPAIPKTTCGQAPDGGVTGATVTGKLTLPGIAQGKKGTVTLFTTLPPDGTPVASSGIAPDGTTVLDYVIVGVPAGTYFLLAFVDVDRSGGTSSTPGDYVGWYGHNGDGNPPATANVVVPETGTVRFDFSLVVR